MQRTHQEIGNMLFSFTKKHNVIKCGPCTLMHWENIDNVVMCICEGVNENTNRPSIHQLSANALF